MANVATSLAPEINDRVSSPLLDEEHSWAATNDNTYKSARPASGDAQQTPSSYLQGRKLLEAVERSGDKAGALAAATFFRDALDEAPDTPFLHNSLGAAYLILGQLASHGQALDYLRMAADAFAAAHSGAIKQSTPPAACIHYQINHATALWTLGERLGRTKESRQAVAILRSVTNELSPQSPIDWAQGQDSLGNALMALGQPSKAIEAYELAIKAWNNPDGKAQTQANLGTAYAHTGNFTKACAAYRKALNHQHEENQPLAWARTQHNLGKALWQEAQDRLPIQERSQQIQESIVAFEAARRVRQRNRAPVDWAVTTTNLATARVSLGAALYANPVPDLTAGTTNIEQGVGLYKEALAELPPADAVTVFGYLSTVLEAQKGPQGDLDGLESTLFHYVDVLQTAQRIRHYNLFRATIPGIIKTTLEIDNLPSSDKMPPTLEKTALIVADIMSVLTSHGIPRTEWPTYFAKTMDQAADASPPSRQQTTSRLPDEVVKRRTTDKTAESSLPALPPGLEWPKETYSSSPEAKRGGGGIVPYLERVWLPLLQIGVANRPLMRAIDPSTIMAVSNFERGNKEMPTHLHIPSKSDLVTAAVSDPEQVRAARRLIRALERQRPSHH